MISEGNPDLDPAFTDNYEIGFEYYFDDIGVIKASAFYKDIANLLETNIVGADDALQGVELPNDPVFQNLPDDIFVSGTRPKNSEFDAKIFGFEVVAERQLTFLPGAWSGLGLIANYTYTDSERKQESQYFNNAGEIETILLTIPFSGDNEGSATGAITYSKFNVDASLSYTWQGRRLNSFQPYGTSFYSESDDSLDFRAQYTLERLGGQNWSVFIAGSDLLKGSDDADVERTVGGELGSPTALVGGNYFGGRVVTVGLIGTF